MAADERQFKTEIVMAAKLWGAHAFTVSERFAAGRPDVYIKHLKYPAVWIELKFGKLNLTPAQRAFIRAEQRAGGHAGWALCHELQHGRRWGIYAGKNPDEERIVDPAQVIQVREHGESIDIEGIVRAVIYG
jgi:hypothetical protein